MSRNTASETRIRGRMLGQGPVVDVLVDNGRVDAVVPASGVTPDVGCGHSAIAPPLFDIQVNGAMGIDLLDPKLTPESIGSMVETLARLGVGHFIPTIVTAAPEVMEHACAVIAKARDDQRVAAAIPGIHVEGPHLNPADGPRGAHPRAYVRPPDIALFRRFYDASGGHVLYTTLAPEVPGALDYIRQVRAMGVHVALGHHHADAETIAAAVAAGATLCTHLGNGAASMLNRHHNPLWPQLAEDRLAASLIADGHHLPDPVLKTFLRVKTPQRVVLTSDCVTLLGLPAGAYTMFGAQVDLLESGKVCLSGTDLLAGSAVPLLDDVVHAAQVTDMSLAEAVACATTIPANLLGVAADFALPEPGATANFICFTAEAPRARLDAAWIRGQRIEE